jgi:superfamily II DNA/RNA helicase
MANPVLPGSTTAAPPAPAPSFTALGLGTDLAEAAEAAGWTTPTLVQVQAIPAVLKGRDLLGLAPTGTGKTAAYLLPLLQRLLDVPGILSERPRRMQVLILAPTRELAAQIFEVAHQLAPQLKTVVAVGGVSINPQMMALRGGAHLVVATPGRLLDLLDHNALRLDDVATLVLDEADRLLDLGFADELVQLLDALPEPHQTLLLSATMPEDVALMADDVLRDAAYVDARNGDAAITSVKQRAILVDTARRTTLLRHLISAEGWDRVLVFVASQYASEHVAEKLRRAGVAAASLHGDLSQGRRSQVLADLNAHRLTVLVATDIAARGIDVPDLAVVVNHDLPRSATDYTHRIGRTGRADASGQAISFICADAPGSEAHFRLIEKRQQQRVPREHIDGFVPTAPPVEVIADATGGVKGKRKSKKDKLREAAAAAEAAGNAATGGPRR